MRHAQRKKTKPLIKLLQIIALSMCSVLLGTMGVFAYSYWDLNNAANEHKPVDLQSGKPKQELPGFDGAFNVLIVGSDSGGGDSRYNRDGENLADVTILVHVSADRSHAAAISIPRDTIVNLPGCTGPDGTKYSPLSETRFNTSLSRGGLACTVKTVETLTGVNIPYAALLQFNSVVQITKTVGGVPICLTGPVYDPYTGLDLPAGEHNIEGDLALAFLRSRYGIGDGSDLARIRSQQGFLSSLVRKMRKVNLAANPPKAYSIFRNILSNATFSTSMNNINTLGGMLLAITKVNPKGFVFMRYPTDVRDSMVYPMPRLANELSAALLKDQPIKLLAEERQLGAEVTGTSSADPTPGVGVQLEGFGQTADQHSCTVPFGQ